MTGAPFGGVDLDLLADYAAGVLDEADSRRVGELIGSDSRWAHAHEALLAADAAVAAQLRAVARVELAMPDDVIGRLDAALDGAAGETDEAHAPVVSLVGRERRAVGAQAGRNVGARSGRRMMSWPWLAAAAAVIGVALLGLPALGGLFSQMDAATPTSARDSGDYAASQESGGNADPAQPMAGELASGTGAVVSFSGADYSATSLKALSLMRVADQPQLTDSDSASAKSVPAPNQQSMPSYASRSSAAPSGRGTSGPVPAELARLLDPVALSACVSAVESVLPGRVATVDFARYEGRPALVVTLNTTASTAGGAARVTAIVVGPACGQSGPDRIAGTDRN